MSEHAKEHQDPVRRARWAVWERAAQDRPDHHILAVELLRPRRDQTLAAITAVRGGRVAHYLLVADGRGGGVRPVVREPPCEPHRGPGPAPILLAEVLGPSPSPLPHGAAPAPAEAYSILIPDPPKDDPPPGVVALGAALLGAAFNLGDHVELT